MYTVKNFESLIGIEGLSEKLLKNHFLLYQGYVNNVNKLIENLNSLKLQDKYNSIEYAELKRRFGWEFNGMRLHELYFENITKGGAVLEFNTILYRKIIEDFGSYVEWEKDFKNTGLIRGIGWSILTYDPLGDQLYNTWIEEHHIGHLNMGFPIVVMDMFEHAFIIDYGVDKKSYIDNFLNIIDWESVALSSNSWLI